MSNPTWYLLCNAVTKRAIDLLQLPDVWKNNTTGMSTLSNANLETFHEWSANKEDVFYTIERAREVGIDGESIDLILEVCLPAVENWVRAMRDPILAATDQATVSDRWNTFDVVSQTDIANYRQALRDITEQDPFNVVWPSIPPELDFLRSFNIETIENPSAAFVEMFTRPAPVKSREQLQADQWLRIRAERESRKMGGIKVRVGNRDYWFWTDETSRNQYALLEAKALRANDPPEKMIDYWKTMSGEFVAFTVGLLHQVLEVGIANESNIFRIAETHRAAMMAAANPLQYDYKKGWPVTYYEATKTT